MLPKISIVIPCYNAVRFIEETIKSVLDQGYPNTECIVIDGGSSDGTLLVLKKYEQTIKWLSGQDNGQSDAINKGIGLATGDIVTFLCADDIYEKGCLHMVANYFLKNPECKWLYGRCKVINESNMEIRRPISWYKGFWQKRYSYSRLLIMDFIPQPAVFWRRELVDEIGLFRVDAHLAMEYDYWLRAGASYEPGFIDEYLANFRLHPVSKSSTRFSAAAREAFDIARKHAATRRKNYVIPLQYLNYLIVIFTYALLKKFY